MIPSVRIISVHQDGDRLNKWVMVDGFARCIENAPLTADLSFDEKATIQAANEVVQKSIASLEVYKSALVQSAEDEPPRLIPIEDGTESQIDNPAWQKWETARIAVENTKAETVALWNVREDPAGEGR